MQPQGRPLNGGWALIDLVGKRQKVRSIPLEAPIKEGIDEWLAAAKLKGGVIFRAIRKNGKVCCAKNEFTVWGLNVVPEMEAGPPEPAYRGWLQTAVCC